MKKCTSELELEAFIREHLAAAERDRPGHGPDEPRRGGGGATAASGVFFSPGGLPGLCSGDSNALELEGSDAGHPWWSDAVRTPHPAAVSTTIESRTTALGSDQSDSDSESLIDAEGGRRFVRGRKSRDTKRIRRMVSNRESARRSRRRKHAQLSDLESQVEQLRSESATLFKQLTEANQQFTTAVTDNRILKSDVETLRVKVKMAEDMVARRAASCGIGQLGLAPLLNSRKMCQALDVLRGTGDGACFRGVTQARQVQSSTVQSTASLESLDNRVSTEVTSCAADMWP